MDTTLNILFLAAEANPFIKVGGLADVAGALPGALRALNSDGKKREKLDVRLVLPFHRRIQTDYPNISPFADFHIYRYGIKLKVNAYKIIKDGVPAYFIGGDPISKAEDVYSSNGEIDREKFTFFSIAALELCRVLKWKVDVIHANDWHTALALYSARTNKVDDYFNKTNGIITIHNLPYLGGEGGSIFQDYGITELNDEDLPKWAMKQILPMGIWAADSIVAVSETYSKEIITPEYGCGLHEYLNKRKGDLSGIINGLDQDLWNPLSDKNISSNFDINILSERDGNKSSLLREINLAEDPSIPLIGMVTRIDFQKGIDLTIKAMQSLVEKPWQLVLLGTGDPYIEAELKQLESEYPDRVRILLRFDSELSHKIYAGADIFLMPSRYEPCGISQMIAMRYGCVPVVHETGGLKDTVKDGETGFLYKESDPLELAKVIGKSLDMFSNKKGWRSLQKNGMIRDFSWNKSACKYAAIYKSLTRKYSVGEKL
jgi:starch synthase